MLNNEKETQVWMSDLVGIIPSITGKIELVYEGEQEGPYQVAFNLTRKSISFAVHELFSQPGIIQKEERAAKKIPINPSPAGSTKEIIWTYSSTQKTMIKYRLLI